jgi:hypothetical protein
LSVLFMEWGVLVREIWFGPAHGAGENASQEPFALPDHLTLTDAAILRYNISFLQMKGRGRPMATLLNHQCRIGTQPDALHAIRDPDCNLAIWQRAPLADFSPLVTGTPNDIRFVSDVAGLPGRLAQELRQNGYAPEPALHHALIEDAANLASVFCAAMQLATVELRLEVVRTDSCRKFHADYVTARLITTYVGEGTDWLDQADAERVAAGQGPQHINRLSAFHVGLFKGKLATATPAIHRSPPIAGTGSARLLLVLNPASRPFVDSADSPLPPPLHLA